jgi:hypothetical protein
MSLSSLLFDEKRRKKRWKQLQLRTKLIGPAIAAALPLLALTGASAATAATAARAPSRATARPVTATTSDIPNNTCWYVTADDGVGLYMRDAGLHDVTTIGDYNACFYLTANGSSYNGEPGYEMAINPHGANCEKVTYSSGSNANKIYDEACDDQHNGDTRETWLVSYDAPYGYLLYNVGAGSFAGVDSLAAGTVVYVGESDYPYWGLEAS